MSQRLSVWFTNPAETAWRPSGRADTVPTGMACPLKALTSLPVGISHFLMVPYESPERTYSPPGITAAAVIQCRSSFGLNSSRPVAACQIRTIESHPPETTYSPSGLMAAALT